MGQAPAQAGDGFNLTVREYVAASSAAPTATDTRAVPIIQRRGVDVLRERGLTYAGPGADTRYIIEAHLFCKPLSPKTAKDGVELEITGPLAEFPDGSDVLAPPEVDVPAAGPRVVLLVRDRMAPPQVDPRILVFMDSGVLRGDCLPVWDVELTRMLRRVPAP